MIESDHSTLNNPPPTPAKPILGSQLLELELKQRKRFTEDGRPESVETGCREIDELLGGEGVERGIVVGISNGDGGEGRLFSLNLLATLLISHLASSTISPSISTTVASVIDTTGSFPLSLLANILKARLSSNPTTSHLDTDTSIQKCLEKVSLSRVFDIEGLWEVLSEIGHPQQTPVSNLEAEIPSSDASATSLLLHSDEPSFKNDEAAIEIIIIDNLTTPIQDLFNKRSKTAAHDLLSLLSRTLYTLTSTSNILTLIHNSVVPTRSNPPGQGQGQGQQQHQAAHHPNQTQTSIFASNPFKPALGQIFSQFPSLHILMSPMPKTREDAELLYAGGASDLPSSPQINYTTVLEVLKDETPSLQPTKPKFGYREHRWTAVEPNASGTGLVCSFPNEEAMRGMDLSRESESEKRGRMGGLTERGRAVKMMHSGGFGGRRV